MPSVYVASPFGFSPATRLYYQEVLLPALERAGFEALDPWDDPAAERELSEAAGMPRGEARFARYREINDRLAAANAASIRRADAMLAVLDGVDVDSGTAAEIGFAAGLNKPVVGLRLDTRLTGDNEGAPVNMQVEHFIGARIVRDLDAALRALDRLFSDAAVVERGEPVAAGR